MTTLTPVYLRSISGNTAVIDTSGNLAVNASVVATANISGQSVNVMSGGGPISIVSGVYLASGISIVGNFTATANISGQAVFLGSGSTTGLSGVSVTLFSGSNNVREVGSTLVNSNLSGAFLITGLSGGNQLFSGGPFLSVLLRSASGNSIMMIGNQPSNSVGIPLFSNETITFKVSNTNSIWAFASTSGQSLYYVGLQ